MYVGGRGRTSQREAFPPARGARVAWEELPGQVRKLVESRLGAPVTSAAIAPEGFSPAFAGTVIDSGRGRTFLKVVGPTPNPDAVEIYRDEIRNLELLPDDLPVPKLLWHTDRGGWVVLAFEALEGHTPRLPWRTRELNQVLDAWVDLSGRLTPAPRGFPTFASVHRRALTGWQSLAAGPSGARDAVRARFGRWPGDHLAELARVEVGWPAASRGKSLVHCDLRADNVLVDGERVMFVDWPHACVGAPWLDPLILLPSVAMQGGPNPWELWGDIPGTERATPEMLRALLAALAGFFVARSLQASPPGLPTLRAFQAGQGVHALRWLRRVW